MQWEFQTAAQNTCLKYRFSHSLHDITFLAF